MFIEPGNGMYEEVRDFIEKYCMLEGIEQVVVGLSGGADSVCLLFMLRKYIDEKKLPVKLLAVHVHHGIRGQAADSDAFFCRELCLKLDVEYRQYNYDVPTLAAEQGMGEEAMGRKLRYDAFRECMGVGVRGVIAVAHHQNDQAETVLFHLVRGCDVKGTRGMAPVSGEVIRPLLCLGRKEIEAWAEENGISYCTDMTNYDDRYTRNCLRNKVIPYLEQHVNRQAVHNICAYGDRMAEINDYIELQAEAAYNRYVETGAKGEMQVSQGLCNEHSVIKRAVLYRCLTMLAGMMNLEGKHIDACMKLYNLQCGRNISLPGRITAIRTYEGINLSSVWNTNKDGLPGANIVGTEKPEAEKAEKAEETNEATGRPDAVILTEEKGEYCGFSSWNDLIHAIIDKKLINDSYTKFFDYGKIKKHIADCGNETGLTARHRQEGDYMVIDSSGRRKKLKELLIDKKIPAQSRDSLWLITIGSMVLWAVGVRGAACFWVDEGTTEIIRLEVHEAGAGKCILEETNEGNS